MNYTIPTDPELIKAEIANLLATTPETTDRGRLFHLLNAAMANAGGGLPMAKPVVDGLKDIELRDELDAQPIFYGFEASNVFNMGASTLDNTYVLQSYVGTIDNSDSVGIIGAKIDGSNLVARIEGSTSYGDPFAYDGSIALETGHTRVYVSTPTYRNNYNKPLVITANAVDANNLALAVYSMSENGLVKLGVTTVAIRTNSATNDMEINAIPIGATGDIVFVVYCDKYGMREAVSFVTNESNLAVVTNLYDVTEGSISYTPRIIDVCDDPTAGSYHIAVDHPVDKLSVYKYSAGIVTPCGVIDPASGSSSNQDTVTAIPVTNGSSTVYILNTRGVWEQSDELTLYKLKTNSNQITSQTIYLPPDMLSKYNIRDTTLTTVKWTSTSSTEAILAFKPLVGTGLHLYDVYDGGILTFLGYMDYAGDSNGTFCLNGSDFNAVVKQVASVSKAHTVASFPVYASLKMSNMDALREADPTNVRVRAKETTNANILGMVGVYDPEPKAALGYIDGELMLLPPKSAVIKSAIYPIVVPKDAEVGAQWTIFMVDPQDRQSSHVASGCGCYLLEEPETYDPTALEAPYKPIAVTELNPSGASLAVVHLVKVAEGKFTVTPLQ